jgi:hypothetical protein
MLFTFVLPGLHVEELRVLSNQLQQAQRKVDEVLREVPVLLGGHLLLLTHKFQKHRQFLIDSDVLQQHHQIQQQQLHLQQQHLQQLSSETVQL